MFELFELFEFFEFFELFEFFEFFSHHEILFFIIFYFFKKLKPTFTLHLLFRGDSLHHHRLEPQRETTRSVCCLGASVEPPPYTSSGG